MRRNALLALGNRSGEVGPRELHAIALGLIDPDPQIAAAARRAALRRDTLASAEPLALELAARRLAAADADATDTEVVTDAADDDPPPAS